MLSILVYQLSNSRRELHQMRNLYGKFNSEARATDYLSAALLVLATRWSQCAFKTISRKTLLTGNGNFSDFSAGVGEACCRSLVKTKRLLISQLRVFRTNIHQCVYLYCLYHFKLAIITAAALKCKPQIRHCVNRARCFSIMTRHHEQCS